MPQASIEINAVPGSDDDLPINTLVQLDNQNIGGELSYLWAILDQPPGTADVLSSTTIQNPTFTPKKEGTYLIKLTVNQGLATEQSQSVIAAIRQLKTRERIPAAGETTEDDAADGWAIANNSMLLRMDRLLSDPGEVYGVNASGGVLVKGDVVRVIAASIIKAGLPGQETVPGFTKALATTPGDIDELLCVVLSDSFGATSVANGAIMRVKLWGQVLGLPLGAGAVGDSVYVSDAGAVSATPGTNRRRIGSIMAVSGGNRDVWADGVGGQDITPIDRRYLIHGAPGTLTDAVRVDGANATGVTTSVRVKAGDVATVAWQIQAFAAGTDLTQWLASDGTTVVVRVTNAGQLQLEAADLQLNAAAAKGVLSSGAAAVAFKVTSNHPLDFYTNNVSHWRIAASGELQAQGGNRAIQNVLDPVTGQDAATMAYTDATAAGVKARVTAGRLFTYSPVAPGGTLFSGAATRYYPGAGATAAVGDYFIVHRDDAVARLRYIEVTAQLGIVDTMVLGDAIGVTLNVEGYTWDDDGAPGVDTFDITATVSSPQPAYSTAALVATAGDIVTIRGTIDMDDLDVNSGDNKVLAFTLVRTGATKRFRLLGLYASIGSYVPA